MAPGALAGPVADMRSRRAAERRGVSEPESRAALGGDDEPETRDALRAASAMGDIQTRDFDEVVASFPATSEPDTVPHTEEEVAEAERVALERAARLDADTVGLDPEEPDTVKRGSEDEGEEDLETKWQPVAGSGGAGVSILADLPTLTYAPSAQGGASAEEEPERASEEAGPGSRFRWPFVVALVVVSAAAIFSQRQYARSEVRFEVERVTSDVARIMTTSPLPLAGEVAHAQALRARVEALEAAGAEEEELAEARAGLRAVEGLLALIAGSPAEAKRALADPILQAHPDYHRVLSASVAALASGGSPEPLQAVLASGLDRPELRGWSARAKLRRLRPASREDADEVLAALEVLASVTPLDSDARLQRLQALGALGRWPLARAELERFQAPPAALREEIWLGELAEVAGGEPERALAWLDLHGLPEGVDSGAIKALGERPLAEAHAALRRQLSAPEALPTEEQRTLLLRLQLAYRLGWSPLPRQILDDLEAVLRAALARRQRLPGPCCVALATLGTPEQRHEVLVAVARREEETKTPSGRLPLQALLATILAARPGSTPGADALLAPLPLAQRLELRRARVAALLELGRARAALLEAQRALERHPGDAKLVELKEQATRALGKRGDAPR